MNPGWLALAALAVALVLEGVALAWRPGAYFVPGLPLPVEPMPLPERPEGEGRTATVSWQIDDEQARFWSWSRGLMGLHGTVDFVPDRRGVRLAVRWAPPWSLLLVATGLGGFGAWLGQGWVAVPVAGVLLVGIVFVYQQAAVRAAAELRWHWSRGLEDVDDPGRGR